MGHSVPFWPHSRPLDQLNTHAPTSLSGQLPTLTTSQSQAQAGALIARLVAVTARSPCQARSKIDLVAPGRWAVTEHERHPAARTEILVGGVPRGYLRPNDATLRRGANPRRSAHATATVDLFSLGSARKWSSESLRKRENRVVARLSRALCRTRTGDPFLTMAAGLRTVMALRKPKRLHRRRNRVPAHARSSAHHSAPSGAHWVPGGAGAIDRPDGSCRHVCTECCRRCSSL
jgi:hypothetical protein